MNLPNFDSAPEGGQMDLNQLYSNYMSGAMAPSNSLLAASLETLSYKNNALKQNIHGMAPGQEELLKKLIQLMPTCQEVVSSDISQFVNVVNNAKSLDHIEKAHALACMKVRLNAETTYQQQISQIQQTYFQKQSQQNPQFFAQYFKQFSELNQIDEGFCGDLVNLKTEFIGADLEFLNDVLLNDAHEDMLPVHLPGFKLSFIFNDQSSLDVIFKFNYEKQLQDVQTAAITGIASELLGCIIKSRNGFFADIVPLTENERKVLLYSNKQAVAQQLQKSLELSQALRAKLTFGL